jgi:hypothetical protein
MGIGFPAVTQLQLSVVRFKSTAEIILLYDLIVRFKPFDFKSMTDIHYNAKLCEMSNVCNLNPFLWPYC